MYGIYAKTKWKNLIGNKYVIEHNTGTFPGDVCSVFGVVDFGDS